MELVGAFYTITLVLGQLFLTQTWVKNPSGFDFWVLSSTDFRLQVSNMAGSPKFCI